MIQMLKGIGEMRKYTFFLVLLLIFSCADDNTRGGKLEQVKGDVFYGGTFRYNEVRDFQSLYPPAITDVVSVRTAYNLYEGLLRLNQKNLLYMPALAEDWKVDSTGTKYIFQIREGVYFHDDECFAGGRGREVTAYDFKYCFDRLCEASESNNAFWIFKNKVKGASEYFEATKTNKWPNKGVEGIKVLDKYLLQIELEKPFPGFLYSLAMPQTSLYPQEAVERHGTSGLKKHGVGTGPFKLKTVSPGEHVIFVKNERYWGVDEHGNSLPYLDSLISYVLSEEEAFEKFKAGDLDMLFSIPVSVIDEVLDAATGEVLELFSKFQVQESPGLHINYLGFSHQDNLFGNKKVRQAFNYAIDKEKIVKAAVKGMGIPAKYGIVPPALVGYEAKSIKGYEYNPQKAKQLLAEAGYKEGNGFPELELYVNEGEQVYKVVSMVKTMLKENLNVDVTIVQNPWEKHLEAVEEGKAIFWRKGWVADYPDAETFLNLYLSSHIAVDSSKSSFPNNIKYRSPEYDTILKKALNTIDEDERNQLYLKADQLAIDDAIIIPLYYAEEYRLLQPYVRNFPQNPMEYRQFREVFLTSKNEAEL